MSIYLRGSTYWADVSVPGMPRIRTTTETSDRAAAKAFERNLKTQLKAGFTPEGKPVIAGATRTLRAAFDKMLETNWRNDKSLSTHRVNANAVCRILGDALPITKVDRAAVAKLKDTLRCEGLAPATMNRKMACLQAMMNVAMREWAWIEAVPYFAMEKEPEAPTRTVTLAEEQKMLDHFLYRQVEGERMHDLCIFLIDTGCRLSEALALHPALDVDHTLKQCIIRHSKTNKPRIVPLSDRALVAASGGLWSSMTDRTIFKRFASMRSAIGLAGDKDFTVHTLRHTCATRLLNAGVDIMVVKEWLGHSTVVTTERYAHLATSRLHEAAQRVQSLGGDLGSSAARRAGSSPAFRTTPSFPLDSTGSESGRQDPEA